MNLLFPLTSASISYSYRMHFLNSFRFSYKYGLSFRFSVPCLHKNKLYIFSLIAMNTFFPFLLLFILLLCNLGPQRISMRAYNIVYSYHKMLMLEVQCFAEWIIGIVYYYCLVLPNKNPKYYHSDLVFIHYTNFKENVKR